MRQYKEGDKSRAICEDCGLVHTTFKMRVVEVGEHSSVYLLASTCDECDTVVSTPPQSTPAIKAALEAELAEAKYEMYA